MLSVTRYLPRLIPVDPDGARQRIADLLEQAGHDPGSVPYGVDALEAVAASLATINDKHDEEPERETYLNWLALRAREHGGTWAEALQFQDDGLPTWDQSERIAWQWIRGHAAMPFPVGRKCLELGEGMPAEALRELMPLEGHEYAFAVEPIGERGGALLFMGKPVQRRYFDARDIGAEPVLVPDGARVEVMPVPQRSIPTATQTEARQRWREANGLPVRAGRHPGPSYWTLGRIVASLLEYVDASGRAPRSREAFVSWAYECQGQYLTPGSEKVTGARWDKMVGGSIIALARAITGSHSPVWTVDDIPYDTEPPT